MSVTSSYLLAHGSHLFRLSQTSEIQRINFLRINVSRVRISKKIIQVGESLSSCCQSTSSSSIIVPCSHLTQELIDVKNTETAYVNRTFEISRLFSSTFLQKATNHTLVIVRLSVTPFDYSLLLDPFHYYYEAHSTTTMHPFRGRFDGAGLYAITLTFDFSPDGPTNRNDCCSHVQRNRSRTRIR